MSNFVEAERTRRGWSIRKTAAALDMSGPSLHHKLIGKRGWNMRDLDKLSAAFELPIGALFMAPAARVTHQYRALTACVTRWYHTRVSHFSDISYTTAPRCV